MNRLYPKVFSGLLAVLTVSCAAHSSVEESFSAQDSPYRELDKLKNGTILHLPTGFDVTKQQLLNHLSAVRIVYVGETHTNMNDHRIQLEILKGLEARHPGRIAVGMEMFQKSSQDSLDLWTRGKLDEKEFQKIWRDNWDQDFGYYRDILHYVRDHKLSLIALNAPEKLVRAAMEKGVEALPEDLRRQLPEMDPTDVYHRRSMQAVYGGHVHGERGFDRFYQTMLIWDETMAQTVSDYLSGPAGRDKIMLVFAGGFHVNYGFGIPRRVFRRLQEPYLTVLPAASELPENRPDLRMEVESIPLPLYAADFIWAVPYEDLETASDRNKVRLGVRIGRDEKGVRVEGVSPDSAASNAGLREGDIIVSFDGQAVGEPFDLIHLVGLKQPGDGADIAVLRGEKKTTLAVRFENRNPKTDQP